MAHPYSHEEALRLALNGSLITKRFMRMNLKAKKQCDWLIKMERDLLASEV